MNAQSQSQSRTRPRRAGVLAVTAGLVLLTAACGGSPSSSGGSSPAGSPSSTGVGGAVRASNSQELAFARCVRAHGIPNFPDPDSSGHFDKQVLRQLGVSDARLRAAQAPCANLLPAGPAPLTPGQQQDYLRAAACMRSHGIANFPDPVFSGGSVHFSLPSNPASVDTTSPQFTQARQICERLIPPGLPYSGSG